MSKKLTTACMFCGGLPCTCDGGPKKKSSTRTRKAGFETVHTTIEKSLNSTQSSSATEASTEDVFGAIPEPVKPKFKTAPALAIEVDLSSLSALRLLRPLVCKRDQRRIDATVNRQYSQDLDRRVAGWKARHAQE